MEEKSTLRENMLQTGRAVSRMVLPKKVANAFVGSKEDEDFLKKNINTPSYEECRKLYKEGKISKEDFIKMVKTREKVDRLQADKDYREVRNKNIGLATADIATADTKWHGKERTWMVTAFKKYKLTTSV